MFSSRLPNDLAPNPLTRLIEAKRRLGVPILDLTESNPTHAGLSYPAEAIAAAFDGPGSVAYEPDPRGLAEARQRVAALEGVAEDRVLLTASTSESYSYLFKLLCDPGDAVLVPRPSYPLFECLADLECVRVKQYPLVFDGNTWAVDFDALERLVDARSRVVMVVHPNNPTGSFLKRAELGRLVELCARHGLVLVSDEVFAGYAFGSAEDRVPTLAGVEEVLTVCLNGLSKRCGLPQMKLGWMLLGGPSAVRAQARERLEWIADTFLSVSTPVQHALAGLLEIGQGIEAQIRTRVRGNFDWLRNVAPPLPVEGGWYAILPVENDDLVLDWLQRFDVLVQPGFFYDFDTGGFVVVSLLTAPDVFREGVTRLVAGGGIGTGRHAL